MTLVELKYLIAVAEELSFRGAAERVHVSQPALSLAIARLEDELGVKLFERSKTEVALTPVGAEVVAQARRALGEIEVIRQVAARNKDPMVGPLRLGMIHTVGPYLVPRCWCRNAGRAGRRWRWASRRISRRGCASGSPRASLTPC